MITNSEDISETWQKEKKDIIVVTLGRFNFVTPVKVYAYTQIKFLFYYHPFLHLHLSCKFQESTFKCRKKLDEICPPGAYVYITVNIYIYLIFPSMTLQAQKLPYGISARGKPKPTWETVTVMDEKE